MYVRFDTTWFCFVWIGTGLGLIQSMVWLYLFIVLKDKYIINKLYQTDNNKLPKGNLNRHLYPFPPFTPTSTPP